MNLHVPIGESDDVRRRSSAPRVFAEVVDLDEIPVLTVVLRAGDGDLGARADIAQALGQSGTQVLAVRRFTRDAAVRHGAVGADEGDDFRLRRRLPVSPERIAASDIFGSEIGFMISSFCLSWAALQPPTAQGTSA